jgi:hypothetical protein
VDAAMKKKAKTLKKTWVLLARQKRKIKKGDKKGGTW